MKRAAKRLSALLAVLTLTFGLGVLVACGGDPDDAPPQTSGAESGVYYCIADEGGEYTLTLDGGGASLYAGGALDSGKYTVDGDSIAFVFENAGEKSGKIEGATIVITLDAEMTFYKRVSYNVKFDCGDADGFTVPTLNGMTVKQPAAPEREGFAFLGWYADAAYTEPFPFDMRILADTTVYARWGEKQVGRAEYTVRFDLNGANVGATPDKVTTVGGKLYDLPEAPEYPGYRFDGWWVSMHNAADKLSFAYTPEYKFEENTTLFALWSPENLGTKLAAPLVNVAERSISWNGTTGVSEYRVEVKNAETGATVLPLTSIGATSIGTVDFAVLAAGDYIVNVTAIASSSDDNSDTTVRYYRNKALKRVSHIDVLDPALLVFGGVQYATEYELNVTCGNPDHAHNKTTIENGSATSFSLANCDMKDSDGADRGITVTVTAKAAGFAPSVSEVFAYRRELAAITSLKYDAATQTVMWDAVDKANGYFVSVNGGEYINNGGTTSFSVKDHAAVDGKLVVKVYPATKGYLSPEAATVTCEKPALYTPRNIRFSDGNTICWDAVTGADGYDVKVGTSVKSVTGTSANIAELFALSEGSRYEIFVRSKNSGGESLYSNALVANYLTMDGLVGYENGMLYWTPVLGGDRMEISVNDGEYVALDTYAAQASVTLGRAGYNTLSVRFVKNEVPSRAVSLQVFAYAVSFDAQNGTAVSTLYKAMGDEVELDAATKVNYVFKGWYNVPGGAASNGALYENKFTVTGDLMLYAYYSPKTFKVIYSYGTYGSGSLESQDVEYREEYKLIVPRTSEPTQMFGGWYTGDNGTGVALTDVNGNCIAPWSIPADTKVYAFWIDDVLRFDKTRLPGTNEDVYRVSQGGTRRDDVTVPSTYNGLPVAFIGANAFDGSYVKVLNIPDTVQIISAEAFVGCSNLTAVNIYRVEGNNAIRYYSHEGVLYDYGALDDQPEDKTWLTSTLQFYPRDKASDNYEVPDRVTTIASKAFEHLSSGKLKAVTFPTSVTYIASYAFSNRDALETITFKNPARGEQVQDLIIGDAAFSGLTGLKTINFPARLKSMSVKNYALDKREAGTPSAFAVKYSGTDMAGALSNIKSLCEINVAAGGKYFSSQDGVLYNSDKSVLLMFPIAKKPTYKDPADNNAQAVEGKFVVPAEVGKIGAGAFIMTKNISEIVIPALITEIGECAFYGSSVKQVTIEGNDLAPGMTVGRYAFRQCTYLEQVTVASNTQIKKLQEGAFMGCSKIAEFTLPGSMTEVGDQAFRGCSSLTALTFGASNNALEFGDFVFDGCNKLATLALPANATSVPSLGGIPLQNVIIAEGSKYLEAIDGVVYSKDKTVLYFYPNAKADATYEIPSTVTTIAPSAFQGAKNLTSVTIGANVREIGDAAFKDCTSLAAINIEASGSDLAIGGYAFAGTAATSITVPARVKSIGEYAFANMPDLATFNLQANLAEIPAGMLSGTAITEFVVKNTVAKIGDHAFLQAESLKTVTFESGSRLGVIGDGAFAETALTSFALPDSVEIIGNEAFASIGNAIDLEISPSSKLTSIGISAFYNSGLENVYIPKNVREIMPQAFAYTNLTEIEFAQDGTADLAIGGYVSAFQGYDDNYPSSMYGGVFKSTEITEIHFPARTTEVGKESFYRCRNLQTVTFAPSGVESRLTYIAEELFNGCSSLTSVVVPKSVGDRSPAGSDYRYAIGSKAFKDCVSLTEVVLEKGNVNAFTIAKEAFGASGRYGDKEIPGITEFTLPRNLDYIGKDAFERCVNLQKLHIDGDKWDGNSNLLYGSYDGVLYTPDFTEVMLCPAAREGKLTLHDNTIRINAKAFAGCSALTELCIPANMPKLDVSRLADCVALNKVSVKGEGLYKEVDGLLYNGDVTELLYVPATIFDGETSKSITLPATLTKIADNAFYNIKGLKEISFENITRDFEIGAFAFYGCTGLTSVRLPASLTKIGKNAFEGCTDLATVEFENGCRLAEFGVFTFANCSSLQAIRIPAAVKEIPELSADKAYVPDYWGDLVLEDRFGGIFHGCSALKSITFEEGSVCAAIGRFGFAVNASFKKLGGSDEYTMLDPDDDIENNILTIEIPQSVRSIGEYAFYGCNKLVAITLPDNLLALPDGLFYYCDKLSAINADGGKNALPDNVSVIGKNAFYYCKSLDNLALPQGVTSIGEQAFYYCEKLESVNIPKATTVIGNNAFSDCVALAEVVFAQDGKLASLPDGMFRNCKALKNIELPASVSAFGSMCFSGTGLTSFVVPEKVVNIPNSAFQYCEDLTSITLHDSIASIGSNAFYRSGLVSINVPASVLSIGDSAFSDCASLDTVVINAMLTEIPSRMFMNCTSLSSVALPNGLVEIGSQAFSGCTSLVSIELPNSVTEIGSGAFSASGLLSFDLPEKVTEVSSRLLYNCAGLARLTLGGNVTKIGSEAFAGTGIKSFEIPATVTSFASDAFAGNEDLTLTVAEGNKSYKLVGSAMWNGDQTKLLFFVGAVDSFVWTAETKVESGAFRGVTVGSVTIEAGVTVDGSMFDGATITNLVIADAVKSDSTVTKTTIGIRAFQKTNIQNVTIGAGTQVGDYAFYQAKLGTVTIKAGATLGSYAFSETQAYSETVAMEVTLGDGVVFSGSNVFKSSKVSALTFGEGVEIRASEAFWNCYDVKTVFIPKSTVLDATWVFDAWKSDQVILMEATEAEIEEFVKNKTWNSSWRSSCSAQVKYDQTRPAA